MQKKSTTRYSQLAEIFDRPIMEKKLRPVHHPSLDIGARFDLVDHGCAGQVNYTYQASAISWLLGLFSQREFNAVGSDHGWYRCNSLDDTWHRRLLNVYDTLSRIPPTLAWLCRYHPPWCGVPFGRIRCHSWYPCIFSLDHPMFFNDSFPTEASLGISWILNALWVLLWYFKSTVSVTTFLHEWHAHIFPRQAKRRTISRHGRRRYFDPSSLIILFYNRRRCIRWLDHRVPRGIHCPGLDIFLQDVGWCRAPKNTINPCVPRGFVLNAVTVPNVTMIGVSSRCSWWTQTRWFTRREPALARFRHTSWKTQFFSLFMALQSDGRVVLLFPMFYASKELVLHLAFVLFLLWSARSLINHAELNDCTDFEMTGWTPYWSRTMQTSHSSWQVHAVLMPFVSCESIVPQLCEQSAAITAETRN